MNLNCLFENEPFYSIIFCNRVSLVFESCRIVCETTSSGGEKSGHASVKVRGGGLGLSAQIFSFQVNSSQHALIKPGYANLAHFLVKVPPQMHAKSCTCSVWTHFRPIIWKLNGLNTGATNIVPLSIRLLQTADCGLLTKMHVNPLDVYRNSCSTPWESQPRQGFPIMLEQVNKHLKNKDISGAFSHPVRKQHLLWILACFPPEFGSVTDMGTQ